MKEQEVMIELEEVMMDAVEQWMWKKLDDCAEYRTLTREKSSLMDEHEKLSELFRGERKEPETLSAGELNVLHRLYILERGIQKIERKTLYQLGQAHFYQWIKKLEQL